MDGVWGFDVVFGAELGSIDGCVVVEVFYSETWDVTGEIFVQFGYCFVFLHEREGEEFCC